MNMTTRLLTVVDCLKKLERAERARERKKQRRKKKQKRESSRRHMRHNDSSASTSSESSVDFGKWVHERAPFLEQERERFIEKWKSEAKEDMERKSWTSQFRKAIGPSFSKVLEEITAKLNYMEMFFANLPLTIGAIALSTANLGVDWFKFCVRHPLIVRPSQELTARSIGRKSQHLSTRPFSL
jgi:hypothetical protein